MEMLPSVLYLATETSGFGLNFNILDTNLINLTIVIAGLVVYGPKFVGNILAERKAKIEEEITAAETKAQEAAAALAEAQQNLAQAQKQAAKIVSDAKETALHSKDAIIAQAKKDIERLKETAIKELDTETAKVMVELKERIATLALERAQSQLENILEPAIQEKLIDRCISQLGGN